MDCSSRLANRLARGWLAGLVGTSMMDGVWFSRYRRSGGRSSFARWEFSLTTESWEEAPAPARLANLVAERLTGSEIPVRHVGLVNDVTHWGYGTSMGALYGLLLGNRDRVARSGILWGAAVWSSSYVLLPAAGVYKPIWRYDATTLARDLSAHLVFGISTATAFALTGA